MRTAFASIGLCLAIAACAAPPPTSGIPADVRAYLERRDSCEHFSGEWPDSSYGTKAEVLDRQKEVKAGLDKYCTGIDAQLVVLRERYASNADVISKLKVYGWPLESPQTKPVTR